MRYRPMTDEQVEDAIEAAIDTALDSLMDVDVPVALCNQIASLIEEWEGWEEEVLMQDYDAYETAMDDLRGDRT